MRAWVICLVSRGGIHSSTDADHRDSSSGPRTAFTYTSNGAPRIKTTFNQ